MRKSFVRIPVLQRCSYPYSVSENTLRPARKRANASMVRSTGHKYDVFPNYSGDGTVSSGALPTLNVFPHSPQAETRSQKDRSNHTTILSVRNFSVGDGTAVPTGLEFRL